MAVTATHLAHDNETRVDTQPYGQPSAVIGLQSRVEDDDGVNNSKAGVHGSLRIILMRYWVAKIDEESVTEILCDMAFEVLNDFCRRLLVCPHDFA
jgi:hypothetical protein